MVFVLVGPQTKAGMNHNVIRVLGCGSEWSTAFGWSCLGRHIPTCTKQTIHIMTFAVKLTQPCALNSLSEILFNSIRLVFSVTFTGSSLHAAPFRSGSSPCSHLPVSDGGCLAIDSTHNQHVRWADRVGADAKQSKFCRLNSGLPNEADCSQCAAIVWIHSLLYCCYRHSHASHRAHNVVESRASDRGESIFSTIDSNPKWTLIWVGLMSPPPSLYAVVE